LRYIEAMKNVQLAARILPNIARGSDSECWPWQCSLTEEGYGRTRLAGERERLAHRLMWTAAIGPIPDGLCVLHRCDNRPCCNPSHLFLGDRIDNAIDRDQKGRNVVRRGFGHAQCALTPEQVDAARADPRGCVSVARDLGVSYATVWKVRNAWGGLPKSDTPRVWVRNPGESNASAKLTADDVLAIRADPRTAAVVAREYGVAMGHVHRIRQRKNWTHI
jgi:hypothetical protein